MGLIGSIDAGVGSDRSQSVDQLATASCANYQREVFTTGRDFGLKSHVLAVNVLNDLYGGTATTDKNLCVRQAGSTAGAAAAPPTIIP